MNKKYESEERISGFLRSIFRFKRMIDKNAPEELLSMEKIILQDKLSALEPEEAYKAVISWQDYYQNALIDEGIEDEQTVKDINSLILTLN